MSDENTVGKQVEIARRTAKLYRNQEDALQYELEVAKRECERQRGRADAFREMKEQAELRIEELRSIAREARSVLGAPRPAGAMDLPEGWEWSDIPSQDGSSTRVLYACNAEGHTVELWKDGRGYWIDADGADIDAVDAVLARHRRTKSDG